MVIEMHSAKNETKSVIWERFVRSESGTVGLCVTLRMGRFPIQK